MRLVGRLVGRLVSRLVRRWVLRGVVSERLVGQWVGGWRSEGGRSFGLWVVGWLYLDPRPNFIKKVGVVDERSLKKSKKHHARAAGEAASIAKIIKIYRFGAQQQCPLVKFDRKSKRYRREYPSKSQQNITRERRARARAP